MRTELKTTASNLAGTLACTALLAATFCTLAQDSLNGSSAEATSVITARDGRVSARAATGGDDENLQIEAIEPDSSDSPAQTKQNAWLGISTREASEDLTSQLDLEAGVGLVVTYVGPDSPAEKAGLKKHDVLVRFGDQALVHPAQLRKLVRVHKQGDEIQLVFYRNGKQKKASVTLGKTEAGMDSPLDGSGLQNNLFMLQNQLKDLHLNEAMQQQMKAMRESLGNIKIDQKKVQEEIRRSMEQAGRAVQEALRNATNADFALNPVRKMLENLANSNVFVDNNARVTVRSSGKGVKSLVNTDDSGAIILVNQPKLHLTAHDKDGELIFDGEIETAEQRAKVPRDLWKRVEPLLDKMEAEQPEEPEHKEQ
jgi:hypothetical protein